MSTSGEAVLSLQVQVAMLEARIVKLEMHTLNMAKTIETMARLTANAVEGLNARADLLEGKRA